MFRAYEIAQQAADVVDGRQVYPPQIILYSLDFASRGVPYRRHPSTTIGFTRIIIRRARQGFYFFCQEKKYKQNGATQTNFNARSAAKPQRGLGLVREARTMAWVSNDDIGVFHRKLHTKTDGTAAALASGQVEWRFRAK